MKNSFTKSIIVCFLMTSLFACQKENQPSVTSAASKKTALDPLSLTQGARTGTSIDINVKAGVSGAPAGFTLQWMTKADFITFGWAAANETSVATSFCSAGFSGVPGCSNYNMANAATITVKIGDNLFDACGASSSCSDVALTCGTEYVFRAFAHNDPKSGLGKSIWSTDLSASTLACETTQCTYGQGYWKTHGPTPSGNNSNVWPVQSLMLGSVSYTDAELLTIFNTPAKGNGLITLAHQLIAAKLNVSNGVDGSSIAATIASADALIGALVAPPMGTGSLAPETTSTLSAALEAFNTSTGCEN